MPSRSAVVERADADPVPAQDQGSAFAVPEGDSELAPSVVEHPLAVVLVEVDPASVSSLRCSRSVPAGEQLLAELGYSNRLHR